MRRGCSSRAHPARTESTAAIRTEVIRIADSAVAEALAADRAARPAPLPDTIETAEEFAERAKALEAIGWNLAAQHIREMT
jgi:hypothetical protein